MRHVVHVFIVFIVLHSPFLLVFLLETSGDFLYEFYLGLIALFMGHVTDYWVIILLKLVMWTCSFALLRGFNGIKVEMENRHQFSKIAKTTTQLQFMF